MRRQRISHLRNGLPNWNLIRALPLLMSRVHRKDRLKLLTRRKMLICILLHSLRKLVRCTSSVNQVRLLVLNIRDKEFHAFLIDGRKPRPIPHGTTSRETFMEVRSTQQTRCMSLNHHQNSRLMFRTVLARLFELLSYASSDGTR